MTGKIRGTYEIHVGNYDWGCSVDRALITLEEPVSAVDPADFSVMERKKITDRESEDHPLTEASFPRKVEDAWLCDERGERVEKSSRRICLSLYVSPEEGSPLAATSRTEIFVWVSPYELHISCRNADPDTPELVIDPVCRGKKTAADIFAKKSYVTSEGIRYDYAEYVPPEDTDTLYVWLHGLGEGQMEGSDAYLPLLGRKGTTMAGEGFQSMIGGARVLVPQCPTYWMDADGKQTNFRKGTIEADGTSYYTRSLEEFIDEYARETGAGKIVLAGCSNGGYMCLMLALSRPDRYTAVVPICEAVPDQCLSDGQISVLKDVPLYFIYSADDPIVVPEYHEIPTIERLKQAGAADLHVFAADKVVDTSGRYKDKDGNPYRYMGHLSWICFDNNETDDGTGLSAWEWIAGKLGR